MFIIFAITSTSIDILPDTIKFQILDFFERPLHQFFFGTLYGIVGWFIVDDILNAAKKARAVGGSLGNIHHIWLAGALVASFALGVAAPQIQTLFGSLQTLETGLFRFQFGQNEIEANKRYQFDDTKYTYSDDVFNQGIAFVDTIEIDIDYMEKFPIAEITNKIEELTPNNSESGYDLCNERYFYNCTRTKDLRIQLDKLKHYRKMEKSSLDLFKILLRPLSECLEEARKNFVGKLHLQNSLLPFINALTRSYLSNGTNIPHKENINYLFDKANRVLERFPYIEKCNKNLTRKSLNENDLKLALKSASFRAFFSKLLLYHKNTRLSSEILNGGIDNSYFSPNYYFNLHKTKKTAPTNAAEHIRPLVQLDRVIKSSSSKVRSCIDYSEEQKAECSKNGDITLSKHLYRLKRAKIITDIFLVSSITRSVAADESGAQEWWSLAQVKAEQLRKAINVLTDDNIDNEDGRNTKIDLVGYNLEDVEFFKYNINDALGYIGIIEESRKTIPSERRLLEIKSVLTDIRKDVSVKLQDPSGFQDNPDMQRRYQKLINSVDRHLRYVKIMRNE